MKFSQNSHPIITPEAVRPSMDARPKLPLWRKLGAIVVALNYSAVGLQSNEPPSLEVIPNPQASQDTIVAISGFGGNGPDLACTVSTFDDRNVIWPRHNGQFDLDIVASQIGDWLAVKQGDNTIHSTSTGAKMAIIIGPELPELDEIQLVTPALTEKDLKNPERLFVQYGEYIVRLGGLIGRLGFEAVAEYSNHNGNSNIQKIIAAWHRTLEVPNEVLIEQANLIKSGYPKEEIAILLSRGTTFVYIAPLDPKDDGTVDNDKAFERLQTTMTRILGRPPNQDELRLVKVGNHHSMTPLNEDEFIGLDGPKVWLTETNATMVNSIDYIHDLYDQAGVDNDCYESFRDVSKTLKQ